MEQGEPSSTKKAKSLEEAVGQENELPAEIANADAQEIVARARQLDNNTRQLKQTQKRLAGECKKEVRLGPGSLVFSPFFFSFFEKTERLL